VNALDRKMFRDLLHMKGQAIAIALVLASGVAMFVMSLTTLTSLQQTITRYYDEYRFADVFAHLKRAPLSIADRLAEVPGVAVVHPRIVVDVNLHVPGMVEPAVGRMISLPNRGEPALNHVYLRRGRWVQPDQPGEVLLSESFATAHDLWPGDTIRAVVNQRMRDLTIAGIVLSPEYIYEIREGEILPDPQRFGVMWMAHRELAPAFDLEGAFNHVSLRLMPGADEMAVIAQVDAMTERYGGVGAFGRDEQTSHRFVAGELDQLRGMMLIVPVIFLLVTSFLLNMVVSRMIQTQREQIAALKAFGYTRLEIAWHYGKLISLIVLVGVAMGTVAGMWLGQLLVDLYVRFFKFPVLDYVMDIRAVGPAVAISMIAALAGTWTALRRAMLLPPAEAMRPEPPAEFRPTIAERMGFQRLFSQPARMVLRNLERQPVKSLLTCLGIAMAVSILIVGNLSKEIIDRIIDVEFYQAQRQDVIVSFFEPTPQRALNEISRMPGVTHVEGFRAVPVRLRNEHYSRRMALLGLPPQRELWRLLDRDERDIPVPNEGVLMSAKLGELLRLDVGELITVEVLEGRRPVVQVPVAGLIEDYTGLSAYMNIHALHAIMREQDAVSGGFVAADHESMNALFQSLKLTPRIASVTIKQATIQSFQDTIAENLLQMRAFTVVFASIIAFGVVYNSARISLAERGRELATLRVIGFTRGEISMILLGELAVLTLIALPIGMAIGYGLGAMMIVALETEHQRLPFVIGPPTYGFAVAVTLVAALACGLVVRRRLDHLDLIEVLKTRA